MKTSYKIAAAAVIGFVAGCTAGFFFQSADVTAGSAKGDIAKVSKFSKNVVSPEMSAFQEKITSSQEELDNATASLTVLTSRMTEFDELVSLATNVSEGIADLSSSVKDLQQVKQLASNARSNGMQALESLNAIANGNKTDIDYEQASQNLALAFMMVDRQINVGKQYVSDVDEFLTGKDVEDFSELAFARDLWADYCEGHAILTEDKDDIDYWHSQEALLSDAVAISFAVAEIKNSQNFDLQALQQCVAIDNAVGLIGNAVMANKESIVAVNNAVMANKESIEAASNTVMANTANSVEQLRSAALANLEEMGVLSNTKQQDFQVLTNAENSYVSNAQLIVLAASQAAAETVSRFISINSFESISNAVNLAAANNSVVNAFECINNMLPVQNAVNLGLHR